MRMTISGIEPESEFEHDHYRRAFELFARGIGRSVVATALVFTLGISLVALLETMSPSEVERLSSAAHLGTFFGSEITAFTILPLGVVGWAAYPLAVSLWKMAQMLWWAHGREEPIEYRWERRVEG